MEKKMMIDGMMCPRCSVRVCKALTAIAGVSTVNVDLPGKIAAIELTEAVDDAVLMAAVRDAGYTPVKML